MLVKINSRDSLFLSGLLLSFTDRDFEWDFQYPIRCTLAGFEALYRGEKLLFMFEKRSMFPVKTCFSRGRVPFRLR